MKFAIQMSKASSLQYQKFACRLTLKIANAYIKALGQDDQTATLSGLNRSAKFVRKRLGPELSHMKYMPAIRFRDDTSFDNYNRIEQLLNKPEVLRDLEQPDDQLDPDQLGDDPLSNKA